MTGTGDAGKGTRIYRSARRDEQARRTRRRIIEAARGRFLASGYTSTTMRAIATAAHVAVQTVELTFGTKRALLKAVVDATIAGDDQPIPVLRRERARVAEAAPDIETFLAIVAEMVRDVAERVAGVFAVLDEAAGVDPEIAALAREFDAQRAATAAWILRGITERASLRAGLGDDTALDTIWLLMDPIVFRRLTRHRGWTADRFQRWFADGLQRLLLPPG